jgi:Ca2+-binding EF-hand superfamily protein
MTTQEFVDENMAIQGGTRDFWEEIATHFSEHGSQGERITFREFIAGLSSITAGSAEEKLDWMFRLFDQDESGTLDAREVLLLCKGLLRASSDAQTQWSEEDIERKAAELFKSMDADGDGQIDRKEFVAAASKDEALLSSLASNITSVAKVEQSQSEFTTFDNQVAGHSTGGMAMLSTGTTIMKPMAEPEFEFYVHAQKHLPAEDLALFPKFFGRKAVTGADGVVSHYIVLEDLTSGLKKANIMDLKFGFRGHDDQARTMKIVQQVALCTITTSSSIGFRLCGMRYHGDDGAVVVHGKPWGAQLKRDTMVHAMAEFVSQHGHIRFDVVGAIVEQMHGLLRFFRAQTLYKFYSSSVLFVWDGASSVGQPNVCVKLVDFAHTYPNKAGDATLDSNSLSAIESLAEHWLQLRNYGEEIWENQRREGQVFGSKFLIASDRAPYSTREGKTVQFANPNDWVVDKSENDEDGWVSLSQCFVVLLISSQINAALRSCVEGPVDFFCRQGVRASATMDQEGRARSANVREEMKKKSWDFSEFHLLLRACRSRWPCASAAVWKSRRGTITREG